MSKEILEKLRNDVRQRPEEAEAWYELAAAALEEGELREARDAMSHVLERAPDHVGANRALGTILEQLGDATEAIGPWRRVVSLTGGDDLEALTRLGIALSTVGQHDEATRLLLDVAVRRGDVSAAHADLGMALLAAERLDEAAAAFGRARELEPLSPQAHCGLGLVYQRQGRWWEAAQSFRQTERLAPHNPVGPMNLGMVLASLGEQAHARQALVRAAALAPGDPEIAQALEALAAPVNEEDEVTRPALRADEFEASIKGDLRTFKLLDVLEFLRVQAKTGALVVWSPRGEGVVRLTEGRVTGASAPGVGSLGEALLKENGVGEESLQAALAAGGGEREELLETLLWDDERVDRRWLTAAVLGHTMEALEAMLDWSEGAFSFHGADHEEKAPPISFNLHELTLKIVGLREHAQPSQ